MSATRCSCRRAARSRSEIDGPFAAACGAPADNLVLKAAAALAARVDGLKARPLRSHQEIAGRRRHRRRFGGCGGGVAPAGARQRPCRSTIARLCAAALAVGADVPVCLESRARIMRGVGEELSAPLDLPPLARASGQSGRAVVDARGVRPACRQVQQSVVRRGAARRRGLDRLACRARQRSHRAGHRLRAGDRRGAERVERAARRPPCPHVGLGADLLCACSARPARPRRRRRALQAEHKDWWIQPTTLR